ncbi:hypothetical protein ACSSS7_006314 [Eimeria intestinalis]
MDAKQWPPERWFDAVAFNEDIFFDHPHTVKAVMITMRKCLHDYFGISEVSPIETGEPALMIVAGITSKDSEMCLQVHPFATRISKQSSNPCLRGLQVEGGTYNKEGAHIVLDACSRAIAAGDGREIWVHNINKQLVSMRSAPKKCITLQDGNAQEGGAVVLTDCLSALEEGDGRSSWTVEPNSQLRLQKSGFYCMTQKRVHGSAPGAGDIAGDFGASAICDSSAGGGHEPAMALDRDVNTFWASGKSARLAGLRIDWEYPALAYKLQVSEDGKDYSDVVETLANPSNVTLDALSGPPAQTLRILMTHPHAANGKVGEGFVYGIREVYVLASRLDTAVSDCKEAANTEDASDKYFLIPIHEFDAEVADKMESLDNDVASRSRTLSRKTKDLSSSMSRATTCVAEKEGFSKRIESQREVSLSLREKVLSLTTSKNPGDMQTLGYLPGKLINYDKVHMNGVLKSMLNCHQAIRLILRRRTVSRQRRVIPKHPLVFTGIKDLENAVVPLAQDMGCLESKCTGTYQTNVVVECPPGCSEASWPPVFGTNGIYSDLSSICRAAIHAGALKSGGIISVSLESSLPAYEGSSNNGIVSEPLNTPNTVELRNELKGEAVEGLPSKRRGRVSRSIRVVPVAKAEGEAATLLNVSGSLSSKLDDLITQLEKVERERQSQIGFESFALNYTRASFADTFETHDTLRTAAGPSSWGYAEVPVDERPVTIGQTSPIKGKGPADGTFAILKSHRFFDGVLHADFNAFEKGTVGIAFRTRDLQNTFLLSFDAEENKIKLIRVEDGETYVVAQAEEGGFAYREAAWQRARVELHHGHIKVAVSEEGGEWKPIIE